MLLNIAPIVSSLIESSFLMSPKKKFTDIQTKFERQALHAINA